MKKIAIAAALSVALSACTSLTYQERNTLRSLQAQGITVDKRTRVDLLLHLQSGRAGSAPSQRL